MTSRSVAAFRRLEKLPVSAIDRIFLIAVVLFTAVQFLTVLITPFDLAPDEAHYWEWSRRLDWNYYSKGPMVAVLIAASTSLLGHSAFAVRFPGLLMSLLLSLLFYRLVKREYGALWALIGWVLLRVTVYFSTLGLVITTDPPVLVCWMGWIWCALRAVRDNETDYWAMAGILLGIAVLSKYTAIILFPSVILFLLFTPSKRSQLKSLGFILGAVLLGVSMLPVLWWNKHHGWVSFAHNAGHLGAQKELAFHPEYLGELLGGQLGLVGPVLLILAFVVCKSGYKQWRKGDAVSGLYFSTVIPLGAVCLGLSLIKRVYVNWPAPVYIGIVLLIIHLARDTQLSERMMTWCARGIILNALLVVLSFVAILGFTFGLPAERLPMKKLVGWHELGLAVRAQLDAHKDKNLFVITDDYGVASEIAFYTPGQPVVYCSRVDDRRMNQYDIWGGLEKLQGRNALIIRKSDDASLAYVNQFASVSDTKPSLSIHYSGEPLRTFYFSLGSKFIAPKGLRIMRY